MSDQSVPFVPRPSFQVHPFKDFIYFIFNELMASEVTSILSKASSDYPRLDSVLKFLKGGEAIGFGGYRHENLLVLITKERYAREIWKALSRNEEELENKKQEVPPFLYSFCTQLDRILEDQYQRNRNVDVERQ